VDNSGARKVMCIQVVGVNNKKYAHIGDVIIVMVEEAISNMHFKKLEVVKAVVVRTCKEAKHKNGTSVQFDDNVVAVINQEGICVFGPVTRKLREFNFTKIVSLAPEVL
jgi:large subunit ribosomal protein L14